MSELIDGLLHSSWLLPVLVLILEEGLSTNGAKRKMKVRAISNRGDQLPSVMLDDNWGLGRESVFPIVVGKIYPVYGISVAKEVFWYYILDEHDLPYPVWYPSPLFEVSDGSIPAHWVANYIPGSTHGSMGTSLISFGEWASDDSFYERLVDGEADAVSAFRRERKSLS